MTPARLDESLSALRWSPEILANVLECDVSLVGAWLIGEVEIPPKTAAWIESLARYHEAAETLKPRRIRGKAFEG